MNKIVKDGKVLEVKHNGKEEGLFGIPSGGGIVKAKATIMSSNKDYLEKGNIIDYHKIYPSFKFSYFLSYERLV